MVHSNLFILTFVQFITCSNYLFNYHSIESWPIDFLFRCFVQLPQLKWFLFSHLTTRLPNHYKRDAARARDLQWLVARVRSGTATFTLGRMKIKVLRHCDSVKYTDEIEQEGKFSLSN